MVKNNMRRGCEALLVQTFGKDFWSHCFIGKPLFVFWIGVLEGQLVPCKLVVL
jgi:hypothetical protein